MTYKPRLKLLYLEKIQPEFMKKFNLKNPMQTPKLVAIHLSMGLGEAINNSKIIDINKKCLEQICGQKVIVTKAKKSIASFKVRRGMNIGIKVTLRKNRMWEFLDRFINIALPRVRDFRGVGSNFDRNGNLTIGVKEQIIFPEIDYKDIEKIRGLNITLTTSSSIDFHAKFILEKFGIPFS